MAKKKQKKSDWGRKVDHQHAAIALVVAMFVVGIALHATITYLVPGYI